MDNEIFKLLKRDIQVHRLFDYEPARLGLEFPTQLQSARDRATPQLDLHKASFRHDIT